MDPQGIVSRAEIYFNSGMHLCLVGPPGIGKTTLVHQLAGGEDRVRTVIGGQSDKGHLLGGLRQNEDLSISWMDGPVVEAVQRGLVLYADELAAFDRDCLLVLHALLDFRKRVFLTSENREIRVHPDFRFIASCNQSPSGYDPLLREFRDRMVYIYVDRIDSASEAELLLERFELATEDVDYLIRFASVLRKADPLGGASTRQLETAAKAVSLGVPRHVAAVDCVLSSIAGSGLAHRDSLLNMIRAEGLGLDELWHSDPVEDAVVIVDGDETWS